MHKTMYYFNYRSQGLMNLLPTLPDFTKKQKNQKETNEKNLFLINQNL